MKHQKLLLLLLLCISPLWSQTRLKYFELKEVSAPFGSLQIENPDCAVLVVRSAISGVRFESNMSRIKSQVHIPLESRYVIYLYPDKQMVAIKASGFVETSISIPGTIKARDQIYYELNEAQSTMDKGSFLLDSKPSGAEIVLDGFPDFRARTPYRFNDYIAMSYNVTLRLTGYDDYSYQMKIIPEVLGNATLELKANFAEMVLSTTPEGVEVFLNGISKGNTPLSLQGANAGITPGNYRLSLRKARYSSIEEDIVLARGSKFQKRYTLEPLYCEGMITSEPPNSAVYLNEILIGRTPLNLIGADKGIDAGKYKLKLIPAENYYDTQESQVELTATEVFSRHIVHQDSRRWLSIRVSENPFEAYLDGQRNTVLERGGEVEIYAEYTDLKVIFTGKDSDRYPPHEQQLRLLSGERRQIMVNFDAFRAKLNLYSEYDDVNIKLRDANSGKLLFKGKTDASLELFPGKYLVSASKGYFDKLDTEMEVSRDSQQRFRISPAFQSRAPKARRNEMLISVLTLLVSSGATAYSVIKADDYYTQYQNSDSAANAADLQQKTEDWDKYTQISIGVNLGAALWTSSAIWRYVKVKKLAERVKQVQKYFGD